MSPRSLTTSTTRRLLKSPSGTNPETKTRCPHTCVTRNSTMRPSGKALSSPLFIQEREESADRRQAYHSFEESLLPPHSFSVSLKNGRPVHELSSLSLCSREKPSREMENETIRILLERQKEQIIADFRAEFQRHEFQADSDWRSI